MIDFVINIKVRVKVIVWKRRGENIIEKSKNYSEMVGRGCRSLS